MGDAGKLTHVDERGRSRMVDVGEKPITRRRATASGRISMGASTRDAVLSGKGPKGSVVEVARIAGIQAAKRTSELIPLCHPLPLTHIDVQVAAADDGLRVEATAACSGPTGVEMEALTAAAVALLTLYDMCKALDRGMSIGDVRLEEKTGGVRGDYQRV